MSSQDMSVETIPDDIRKTQEAMTELLAKFENAGDRALFAFFKSRNEKLVRVGVDW